MKKKQIALCAGERGQREGETAGMNGLHAKAIHGLLRQAAGYLLAWVSARAPMMGILKR